MDSLPPSFVLNDAAQSGLSDEENEDIRASSIIKTEIDLGADDILEDQTDEFTSLIRELKSTEEEAMEANHQGPLTPPRSVEEKPITVEDSEKESVVIKDVKLGGTQAVALEEESRVADIPVDSAASREVTPLALEDIGSQDKAPLVTVSLDSALQLDTSPLILEEASARLLDTIDSRKGDTSTPAERIPDLDDLEADTVEAIEAVLEGVSTGEASEFVDLLPSQEQEDILKLAMAQVADPCDLEMNKLLEEEEVTPAEVDTENTTSLVQEISAEDFAASERARKLAELKKTEDLINQAIVSVDHHQNSRLAPSAISEHDYSAPPNPCYQPAPWNFSQSQFPPHPVAGHPFPSEHYSGGSFYRGGETNTQTAVYVGRDGTQMSFTSRTSSSFYGTQFPMPQQYPPRPQYVPHHQQPYPFHQPQQHRYPSHALPQRQQFNNNNNTSLTQQGIKRKPGRPPKDPSIPKPPKQAKPPKEEKPKHIPGTKPYACDKCEKAYARQESLARHYATSHDGRTNSGAQVALKDQPFRCEICDQGFTFDNSRKRHMRKHTGEMPYPCPHCGQRFMFQESERRHSIKCPYKGMGPKAPAMKVALLSLKEATKLAKEQAEQALNQAQEKFNIKIEKSTHSDNYEEEFEEVITTVRSADGSLEIKREEPSPKRRRKQVMRSCLTKLSTDGALASTSATTQPLSSVNDQPLTPPSSVHSTVSTSPPPPISADESPQLGQQLASSAFVVQNNELAHLTEAQNLTSGGGYYPAPATPPEMSVLSEIQQYDIKPQVLPDLDGQYPLAEYNHHEYEFSQY